MKRRYARDRHLDVPIDLNIDITNFGPVSKGSVKIRPLTIFVGPNNSGKSYVAMLIHSILTAENRTGDFGRPYGFAKPRIFALHDLFQKEIQKIVKRNKGKESFEIPTTITKKTFASIVRDQFSENLESAITGNFGAPACDLIRAKQRRASISVSNSREFDISIGKKLSVKTDLEFNAKYKVRVSKEYERYPIKMEGDDCYVISVDGDRREGFVESHITFLIIDSMRQQAKHNTIPENSFYFPASRSGILQGHKALSASIVKSAQFGGVESFQIPKLTGVVSDFISDIIDISNHKGPFYKIAEQLENELLHGHIKLSATIKGGFPEIKYDYLNKDISLHRTSSAVSELAPFTLYLKYIVDRNSILIIEEPEAHLHPRNQLIFAKYIVRLIREGLNILITTHSVFLLEQLSMFLQASSLSAEVRQKKLGFLENDYLLPEEVSPYVFTNTSEGGNTVEPIDFSGKDGISQEEFVKISEILHDQSIRIEENLS